MQFPAQAICTPEHFRYNPIPKTKVLKTRTDLFSTIHDPAHYSAHDLAEHFILLYFRLHEISVESKNTRIRVQTGKLWSSEVGIVDSQGWCENSGTPPFSILPRFSQFWDVVLGLDGLRNSYTMSMTVPQSQTNHTTYKCTQKQDETRKPLRGP